MSKGLAIIGAGAAGCFCASLLRETVPSLPITIFEAGEKPLAKLAITGGGRCNLTNSFAFVKSLKDAYPRGESVMKRALKLFSKEDTLAWFRSHGVDLVLQEDGCYFPASQDSASIVNCLLRGMKGSRLVLSHRVKSIGPGPSVDGEPFDYVLLASGGAPKGLPILDSLGIETVKPVPSLYTFNIKDKNLTSLQGLVVEASLSIPGTSFKTKGALLITDWGISGPATLKLSSHAARFLADRAFSAPLSINWLCQSEREVREKLLSLMAQNPSKMLVSTHLLPSRLWTHLVLRAGLREDIRWKELGQKGLNKFVSTLVNDNYSIEGKGKFKEEFVTSGGVSLREIDLSTLESKTQKGLYFAGEVLDIDAITGGFNLQAAWSTAACAARSITRSL